MYHFDYRGVLPHQADCACTCPWQPPDVRMTGDFDVTVERLIRHWHGGIATPEVGLKWVHQLDMGTCLAPFLWLMTSSVDA